MLLLYVQQVALKALFSPGWRCPLRPRFGKEQVGQTWEEEMGCGSARGQAGVFPTPYPMQAGEAGELS